jgi:hypothetical protein
VIIEPSAQIPRLVFISLLPSTRRV